jgi:hypothetical protein
MELCPARRLGEGGLALLLGTGFWGRMCSPAFLALCPAGMYQRLIGFLIAFL